MTEDTTRQQSRFVTLPSGITLHYVVQGDPVGQPIVLIHGLGDSWRSYERVLPLLPAKYRVYALTLRGHGGSDHPATGFATTDFAADVVAFLRALGLKHVLLAGHSLGSFVVEQVAADEPDLVWKLVLVGAGPGTISDPRLRQSLVSIFERLQDPIDYVFARDFQASTIHAAVPPAYFETLVAETLKAPANTWHGVARAWSQGEDGGFLRRIRAPALVLWGDRDSIFSHADQDAILENIAHATLIVYTETGHAPHWEQPERFTADLLRFVADH